MLFKKQPRSSVKLLISMIITFFPAALKLFPIFCYKIRIQSKKLSNGEHTFKNGLIMINQKEVEPLQKEFKLSKIINDRMKKKKFTYAYAYDPLFGRRVAHVVYETKAISLVTGHKIKISRREFKEIMKYDPKK